VAGQDARTNVAASVGVTPVTSWAPPTLGTATSYTVGISELRNDAGSTIFVPVLSAQVRGLSFQVPPGFLTAGRTYAGASRQSTRLGTS